MPPSSWTRYLLLTICLLGLGCEEAGLAGARAQTALPAEAGAQPAAEQAAEPTAGPTASSAPQALASAQVPAPPAYAKSAPRQEPETTPDALEAPLETPLLLQTKVEAEGSKWTARWRITNRGSSPIYLVTQLPALQGGEQVPAPAAIYRRVEGDTLYLTKRLWRVPAVVDALITMVPFLIRLEPGQVHVGGVRIPAASRESYPYQDGYRRAGIARLVISFGYFDAAAQPSASPAHPGLYRVPYSALSQQRYLTSEPAPVRLVVR